MPRSVAWAAGSRPCWASRPLRQQGIRRGIRPSRRQHSPAAQAEGGEHAREVALDRLSPNPHQPRSQFDAASLGELADSIRVHGIIQPLVVTPARDQAGHYWIIAGERRWRAARLADLTAVPVLVREASPQALTELALVENIQRDDLNALEEALAYQALMNDYGLTQAEVAERVGKSRSAVANAVRLLALPEPAQQAVVAGRISAGHARALLALPDTDLMLAGLTRSSGASCRSARPRRWSSSGWRRCRSRLCRPRRRRIPSWWRTSPIWKTAFGPPWAPR